MYQLTRDPAIVLRLVDGASVPVDAPTQASQAYQAWLAEPNEPLPAPPPSNDELLALFADAAQQRLDAWARTRHYDGIVSLCTYVTDPNPRFSAEAARGVERRSATYSTLYEILDAVLAGTRPLPASFAEIEPELPAMTWSDE